MDTPKRNIHAPLPRPLPPNTSNPIPNASKSRHFTALAVIAAVAVWTATLGLLRVLTSAPDINPDSLNQLILTLLAVACLLCLPLRSLYLHERRRARNLWEYGTSAEVVVERVTRSGAQTCATLVLIDAQRDLQRWVALITRAPNTLAPGTRGAAIYLPTHAACGVCFPDAFGHHDLLAARVEGFAPRSDALTSS